MPGWKSLTTAIGAGVLVGAVCTVMTLVPWFGDLEQEAGLPWLFRLRGSVAPPEEVVIVAMNRRSASNIYLPRDPDRFHRCRDVLIGSAPGSHINLPEMPARWPRCLHAKLVQRLTAAGAQVVAFDVLFRQRPPLAGNGEDVQAWQDEAMATAFASGRVVIAQKLELFEGRQRLIELSPAISGAALGAAPFPVLIGKYARVDRFMAFQDSGWATPTLPALALHAYALDTYPILADLVAKNSPHGDLLQQASSGNAHRGKSLQVSCLLIRHLFRKDPAQFREALNETQRTRLQGLAPEAVRRFRAVLSMYEGEPERLLNFYGPAGTFPTMDYDQALGADPDRMRDLFRDRVVFVGYAEPSQHEQVEHFATAFSSTTGPDLSGVEIAATAFSNLLNDSTIRQVPAPYWALLVFAAGFVNTVAFRVLPMRQALPAMMLAIVTFAGITLHLFSSRMIWIPFMTPLLISAPVGMMTAFTWNFQTARRQRENLRRTISNFIPKEVADQFEDNAKDMAATRRKLECGCVATDAANYTPLAETMESDELTDFLNKYFDALFRPVGSHGGFVSDVVGDAMLALWPLQSGDTRAQMLDALLQMRDAARHFNRHFAQNRLNTRFGVDWGPVTLGTVGAHRHYEYRAVGDTVNTASRIQELNKKLGTTLLVSRRSIGSSGDGFLVRDVGRFILRGKKIPVDVCEVIDRNADAAPEQFELCSRFAESLEAAYHGSRPAALSAFRKLHASYPQDGPTAFYLQSLEAGHGPVDDAFKVN